MIFRKAAHRVYVATVRVSLLRSSGFGAYETTVSFRLDGREGKFYRVDMMCLTPWEAIDGGRDQAPSNKRAAEEVAQKYLKAVNEQGTLHPRMAS